MKSSVTDTNHEIKTTLLTTSSLRIPTKLSLTISNVPTNDGNIMIAIYNDELSFMTKPYAVKELTASNNVVTTCFDLPMGEYSILIFQDKNGDGILNRNNYGIPVEPWTTSATTGRTAGKPTWSQTNFRIADLTTNKSIHF